MAFNGVAMLLTIYGCRIIMIIEVKRADKKAKPYTSCTDIIHHDLCLG